MNHQPAQRSSVFWERLVIRSRDALQQACEKVRDAALRHQSAINRRPICATYDHRRTRIEHTRQRTVSKNRQADFFTGH